VVNDVKGLITALGEDQARLILSENAPYNQYDTEALIKAATA
jgi:hypothetical protein